MTIPLSILKKPSSTDVDIAKALLKLQKKPIAKTAKKIRFSPSTENFNREDKTRLRPRKVSQQKTKENVSQQYLKRNHRFVVENPSSLRSKKIKLQAEG